LKAPRKLNIPPDAESIEDNKRRERLLFGVGVCLFVLAILFGWLWKAIESSSEIVAPFVAIFALFCFGLGAFTLLAITWRRVCGWCGHDFQEIEPLPDLRDHLYQCRHCRELRGIKRKSE
jgi:hypothetical protein